MPRLLVLKILEGKQKRHYSAEDVYRALLEAGEEVGLATVYRVLTQFEQSGLVMRHNFEGGHAVFELSSNDHHDHMICVDTGEIIEFHDEVIEQAQERVATEHGFDIINHALVLYVRKKNNKM